MRVLSVCSGVGTDALAWSQFGWTHVAFAEIGAFASALLAYRWPEITNLGDFTRIRETHVGAIDLLVGGTPCQDFSVAGLRAGLDGSNGVLALEYLRLAGRLRPRWVVWENVRGALSANHGRAFGSFLGGLAELGYGFAYRVLDAQYFGLAQRRERVFVVGHLGGSWQRAAAVLFERAGMRGDPPPRRETWQEVAGALGAGSAGGRGWRAGGDEAAAGHIVGALKASDGKSDPGVDGAAAGRLVAGTLTRRADRGGVDGSQGDPNSLVAHALATRPGRRFEASDAYAVVPIQEPNHPRAQAQNGDGIGDDGDPMYTLTRSHPHGVAVLPFDTTQITHPENRSRPENGDPSPTLTNRGHGPAVAFHQIQDPISGDVSPSLGSKSLGMGVLAASAVRRLTPRECERLMGYPDDYTAIPYRGGRGARKTTSIAMAKDGPRYAAIGNGIAMPVLRWIGERIAMVDAIEVAA